MERRKERTNMMKFFLKDIPFQQTHIWLFHYRVVIKLCGSKKKRETIFQ